MEQNHVRSLLQLIENSPTCFHVVRSFRERLLREGYSELEEVRAWDIQPGGKYFVTRNGSSLLAFRVPKEKFRGFMLAAAHSDSPTFKLKENPEQLSAGHYVQLNTEKYGGMLMSSWLDRPLSVAGRVLVRGQNGICERLVNIDRDLCIIPNVAIHMNRSANYGTKYAANVDTLPLLGGKDAKDSLLRLAAEQAGVRPEDLLGTDLYLYLRQPGTVLGASEEYIAAPRLDDLECAYGCMEGFLQAEDSESIPVCCIFDNEEVGSGTRQGAASTLLRDMLRRVAGALGCSEEQYQMLLAQSFLVSADNAHAQHPNHPEYADRENCPYPNEGIVVKYNANQRYATDAVSSAIFRSICADAHVPVQTFANRSDLPGGSTLGSIADTEVPVRTVDIGLAQLAMHSAYETAGARDLEYLVQAMTAYFGRSLHISGSTYTV